MASEQPIVIKKIKKGGGHGHHGGAWKVAYADFVTAMMAFFLLMWLINTTTPEQKRGIADYFAPASVSPSNSGSGSILSGTTISNEGDQGRGSSAVIERLAPQSQEVSQSNQQTVAADTENQSSTNQDVSEDALANALARRESAQFASASMSLRQALQSMPELAELSRHVMIDETPEGLRIQLVDEEGRSMFEPGSTQPNERAIVLLRAIGEVLNRLPNRVSISGHTDAAPAPRGTTSNWELSAQRANAAREILEQDGLSDFRIAEVTGKSGSEPLFPDDPYLPGNRRLSIVLLREAPVLPPNHSL
ncbi:flagellar motor protein MotB [Woodsholea maritima]|uniref:flagellar motor protein MotB n=1 Tax=Woodsholea maritima TaxID=240237 RepID=UPI000376E887|nr:flagellar motor protein MotB [Woodsholea maritima]